MAEMKVKETVLKYKMISPGDKILVGLSGGADSVCLLLTLNGLRNELGISRLAAAHINHGIRATAKRDADFAKELCLKNGIEFFIKNEDIPGIAKEYGICEEEAGRIARYSFFDSLRKEHGFNKVATAHNMNDQAETFLMRIISGSSLEGLECIKPVREDGIIRPLIETKREEIEKYLENKGQSYMTDETNEDTAYRRNSVRHELLKLICEKYNPSFVETAASSVEFLSRDSEFIRSELEERGITDDCEKLSSLPDALLIRALKKLTGKKLSKKSLNGIMKTVREGKNGAFFDAGGELWKIEYGRLVKKEKNPEEYCCKLSLGENRIDEINAVFTVSEGTASGKNVINIPSVENISVRTRKEGDRIFVKGCGHKKIKDIFIDRKIPAEKRSIWPLVTLGNEIIWVTGIYKNEKKESKYNIKAEWRI